MACVVLHEIVWVMGFFGSGSIRNIFVRIKSVIVVAFNVGSMDLSEEIDSVVFYVHLRRCRGVGWPFERDKVAK